MADVAFIHHPDCVRHLTGEFHPERPERTAAIVKHLEASALGRSLTWETAEPARVEQITAVHTDSYRAFVEEACLSGRAVLDAGDTQCCEESYEIALLSAGGAIGGVDAVMQQGSANAFCCIRPPGHHALASEAMGFCLFNNVAIAARHAQQQYGVERVLIVDWDVHHGNGTQDIFYESPDVFFFSIHQYPFYPGTGAANERGRGKGEGTTLNVPVSEGATIKEYREAFREQLLPAAREFRPDIVLLSAGYDAHRDDPLAMVNLDDEDFAELARAVRAIAEEQCGGRLVAVLEGGYNLDALARSVKQTVRVFAE